MTVSRKRRVNTALAAFFAITSTVTLISKPASGMMRGAITLGLLISTANASANEDNSIARTRLLMGTYLTISIDKESYDTRSINSGFDTVRKIEKHLSTYRPKSEVSLINSGKINSLSPILAEITRYSLELAKLTQGSFSPTLHPALRYLRELKRESFQAKEFQETLAVSNYKDVVFDDKFNSIEFRKPGMGLNFGGIGKGYAIDKLVRILKDTPNKYFSISFGESSLYYSQKPLHENCWKFQIAHPTDKNRIIASFFLREGHVSTSNPTGKIWQIDSGEKKSHIIKLNKSKFTPDPNFKKILVIANNSTVADGLSTAIVASGYQTARSTYLKKFPKLGTLAVFIDSDNNITFQHGKQIKRIATKKIEIPAFTRTVDQKYCGLSR